MADTQTTSAPEMLHCTVHPKVETTLRCNRCGRPMCTRCAVLTQVGYRCKECVRGQQQAFFNANPLDPLIQGGVSFILSLVAAAIASLIGAGLGFFALFIFGGAGAAAGALISDIAHRAVGRRRGRYSWLVVAGGIVAGALVVMIVPLLFYAAILSSAAAQSPEMVEGTGTGMLGLGFIGGFANIGWWIYVITATGAAVGRLRMGR